MKIVTLTLNPALDKSTRVEQLQPKKKLRCDNPVYEAGGGGINISRAIKILGGNSLAMYAAGGPAGETIHDLLAEDGIEQQWIEVRNPTRVNFMVLEKSTSHQYRFGMPGKALEAEEQDSMMKAIQNLPRDVEYIVGSGSLPPGVSSDFYGKIVQVAKERHIKSLIDTSGEALIHAADKGPFIMKPNLGELSTLAGRDELSGLEQEEIARKIIREGKAEILVVSMGARGAMVVTKDRIEYVIPPTVKQKSTVGAGDSMVAAILLSLSRGEKLLDAVKWGVAAGTAATITPGTELCRKDDVERIFRWLNNNSKAAEKS
jgi:6-phosphofructokinase 2